MAGIIGFARPGVNFGHIPTERVFTQTAVPSGQVTATGPVTRSMVQGGVPSPSRWSGSPPRARRTGAVSHRRPWPKSRSEGRSTSSVAPCEDALARGRRGAGPLPTAAPASKPGSVGRALMERNNSRSSCNGQSAGCQPPGRGAARPARRQGRPEGAGGDLVQFPGVVGRRFLASLWGGGGGSGDSGPCLAIEVIASRVSRSGYRPGRSSPRA